MASLGFCGKQKRSYQHQPLVVYLRKAMNVELVSLTLIGIDVFMQNQLQDEDGCCSNSLILTDCDQKQKEYDKEGFRCTEL